METNRWEERYHVRERPEEDFATAPTPLVVETASRVTPGRALDLACGTGRNAIWLAQNGWKVTAVDSSPTAIELLVQRAGEFAVQLDASIANLENGDFQIAPAAWDLILICYYLQRDLFELAKQGVAPNGIILAIAHITEANELPTRHHLKPGELESYFTGWDILHHYEGRPNDPSHRRSVAEIVARRNAHS
jgi:SAM-dependent methyltransferase